MNYTNPELTVLGEAVRVIEQFPNTKGITGVVEVALGKRIPNPAYDFDE